MLRTFPYGGVHPPENKLTAGCKIETLPPPKSVVIPVSQHLGAPAVPQVKKGDKVLAGQLIAAAAGYISSNIHSSVSGKVSKIDTHTDSTGYRQTSVFIDTEGDEWIPEVRNITEPVKEISLSPEEIVQKCLDAGIVGLGGATFPTHVKLKVPAGKKCDLLIVNGVECEPYLTSDHRLMLEKGEEIITGTRIMMKALGVKRAVVGLENNKPDAISLLQRLSDKNSGISVQALKVKYPQGGEKQLIKAITGMEVPSGKLPLDVGVIVQNTGTAYAVYEAVQKNKPLVERVVTITGRELKRPGNYLVRIGTPVSALIEAAGGLPENSVKVVSGGPMMGKALGNTNVPVVKGTSGLIVFSEEETGRKPAGPCIRCSKCISVCPMGLEPYLLMTLSEKALYDKAHDNRITDCIECGSCSYKCPAYRPLLDHIRIGKSAVLKILREKSVK